MGVSVGGQTIFLSLILCSNMLQVSRMCHLTASLGGPTFPQPPHQRLRLVRNMKPGTHWTQDCPNPKWSPPRNAPMRRDAAR